jgi:hypothetical protein
MNKELRRLIAVGMSIAVMSSFAGCRGTEEMAQTSEESATAQSEVTGETTTSEETTETTTEATTEQTTVRELPEGTIVLPGTEITFELPEGYTATSQVPGMEVAVASPRALSIVANNTVYSAGYNDDGEYSMCGITMIYLGGYDIATYDYSPLVEDGFGYQMAAYDSAGVNYERRTEDITLNGYTCTAEILETIPAGDEPSVSIVDLFVGDEDTVYMTMLMTPAENGVEEFLEAFGEY